MEISEQLDEWVKGNPIHNKTRDECCPDFSCCNGRLAPKNVRERFAKAYYEGDKETQYQMLSMFLGEVFAGKNVYVADSQEGGNKIEI